MNDLDMILSAVENPTRRRILMALVREPHYPLQLSRELRVSQQAIMKNLNILEKSGLVESRKEKGDKGPNKMIYRPTSEFTLMIDLRNGMFRTTLSKPENIENTELNDDIDLAEIREYLSEIDRQIVEFEEFRSNMVQRRNAMIRSFMSGPITGGLDYLERGLLYEMLNCPDHDITRVSRDLGIREERANEIMDDIEFKCRNAKESNENE